MSDPTPPLRQPSVEGAPMNQVSQGPPTQREPCRHDSTRNDGLLDNCCLLCGANGYWHFGHRHDVGHPGGKVLIDLFCPDSGAPERES